MIRRVRTVLALYRWPAITALVHVAAFDLVCYGVFYRGAPGPTLWVTALALLTALPFVFALGMSRVAALILVPLGFLLDGTAAYFVYFYKIDVRPDTLAFLYETNFDEAAGFLDPALFATALASLGAGVGLARLCRDAAGRRSRYGIVALLALVPVAKVADDAKKLELKTPPQLPVPIIAGTLRYVRERARMDELVVTRTDFAPDTYRGPDEDVTMVFVLGESARPDHFSLNGYGRPTNPRLATHEVVSFRDVAACDRATRRAVPCLLTRSTSRATVYLREKSFVSVFRAAGFRTGWLSNQRVLHKKDSVAAAIAAEAQVVRYSRTTWAYAQDAVLLPWMRAFLARGDRRQMLVVHTIGSHWPYFNRHDAAHAKFQPGCQRRNPAFCSREQVVNSYDNSILYTDAFLADTIALLRRQNAMLLYVADHGESLGENGRFMHGGSGPDGPPEQFAVPLIVWTSPEFRRRHPERVAALRARAATPVTHDVIFHSLLDCAGVTGSVVDTALSICRAPTVRAAR